MRANTFKRGRATKPSTSCPELGRNWMKHEDALFSLFSIYDVHNMGVKVIPLTGSYYHYVTGAIGRLLNYSFSTFIYIKILII